MNETGASCTLQQDGIIIGTVTATPYSGIVYVNDIIIAQESDPASTTPVYYPVKRGDTVRTRAEGGIYKLQIYPK